MNKLNVFHFGIYSHRPRAWLSNIKQFFRNCKYAYQRAVYGYCRWDYLDTDQYLAALMHDMLLELADNSISYPSNYTPEEWQSNLRSAAMNIREAMELVNGGKYAPDLYDEYAKAKESGNEWKEREAFMRWKRQLKENEEKVKVLTKDFFSWIGENFYDLWD